MPAKLKSHRLPVAPRRPPRESRKVCPRFLQDGGARHLVEGIGEVELDEHLGIGGPVPPEPRPDSVDGNLGPMRNCNPNLQRPEMVVGISSHDLHETLAREPSHYLPNSNGTHPTIGLWQCYQASASQNRGHEVGRAPTRQELHHACQVGQEGICAACYTRILQMLDPKARAPWRSFGRKGPQALRHQVWGNFGDNGEVSNRGTSAHRGPWMESRKGCHRLAQDKGLLKARQCRLFGRTPHVAG